MQHEAAIRLASFIGVLALISFAEFLWPRRGRPIRRLIRWPNNLAVVFIDTFLARIVLPAGATGIAFLAEHRGWGLFNAISAPAWISVPVTVLLLDLLIYFQHWAFHRVPLLWRLHRMHHADLDVDATTGARFHPIEILLSLGIKSALIIPLGAPAVGVLVFEVLLNATAMFNHGNLRLPPGVDRWLRLLVVTPDMHRVHHSILIRETNSNFGFNVSWWDRLFRTYRAQPEAGHDGMTLGLEQFRNPKELRIDRMLLQPFRGGAANTNEPRSHATPGTGRLP
jgi:sterol desaturase/sphingolipid hydroxylase (fatty acid hydroxylase superfamily)